jgi:fructuronate reductase
MLEFKRSMPVASPLLSASTLASARAGTQRPAYDRDRLRTGIVHLGLGAFVPAHQALYTEDLLATEPADRGMTGVSLQRPDQRDRIMPQDGLYTTLQRDPAGLSASLAIGAGPAAANS